MHKLLSIIFLIITAQFSFGQVVALDEACLKHLGERANSLKVKTYATRIDQTEGSVIVLKKENGTTKGVLYFPKSRKSILMNGTSSMLFLRDEKGFDQGKISYSIDNQQFKGTITSSLNKKTATIQGAFTRDVPVIPPACYQNKWLVYHQGKLDNKPVHIYLQRIGNGDLQGTIYFVNKKQSAYLSGIITNNKVDLVVSGILGQKVGDLVGNLQQGGGFKGQFITNHGKERKLQSTPIISDNQSCFSSIDMDFRYSIIYPKFNIKIFDDYLDQQSNQWIRNCKKLKKETKTTHSSILNSPSAYSYIDVHCRDEYIFSGFQVSYLPKGGFEIKGINFDLHKNKILALKDVFDDAEAVRKIAHNRGQKNIQKHHLRNNKDFVRWASQTTLSEFVLQPDGVLFSSNYHSVFGKYMVLISYAELKPYVKNKKLIKHFNKLR